MSKWTELKTLQKVVAAIEAGEEVEGYDYNQETWFQVLSNNTGLYLTYRSRPKKTMQTIVLREALFCNSSGEYSIRVCGPFCCDEGNPLGFVKWMDTPHKVVTVEV